MFQPIDLLPSYIQLKEIHVLEPYPVAPSSVFIESNTIEKLYNAI